MCRSHDNLIGLHGSIPWSVPEDRLYFKLATRAGILVMGRKTWEENGVHLPHARRTVVISGDEGFRESIKGRDKVMTARSLEE
ncbi:hypothetical protein TrRE_jg5323, partial [Triparma retinervis]